MGGASRAVTLYGYHICELVDVTDEKALSLIALLPSSICVKEFFNTKVHHDGISFKRLQK